MVYKLYGHPFSTCTNRVLIVAKQVRAVVEFHNVDLFKGEHKNPDFLEHHHLGKFRTSKILKREPPFTSEDHLPVAFVGSTCTRLTPWQYPSHVGVTFFSLQSCLQYAPRSRAIAKYIAVKARAGNLIALESDPAYFKKVALYEPAIFVETTNFERFGASLMYECLFKEVSGQGKPDPKQIETLVNTLSEKLDGYERILSKQTYLAGDEMTLADLFHAPIIPYFSRMGQSQLIESRPNVSRWWQSLWALKSVQAIMADDSRKL